MELYQSTLADIFEDAKAALDADDLGDIAGVALDLAQCNTAIMARLEPLKVRLRDHAATRIEGDTLPATVRIPCEFGGEVTVTFPAKQLKLTGGYDMESLKEDMGDRFAHYFDTRVSYKPRRDARAKIAEAGSSFDGPPEMLHDLVSSVEYVEPTPRVGFKNRVDTGQ